MVPETDGWHLSSTLETKRVFKMAADEKESAIAEEEAIEIENEKESETGLFTLESILHK